MYISTHFFGLHNKNSLESRAWYTTFFYLKMGLSEREGDIATFYGSSYGIKIATRRPCVRYCLQIES